MPALRYLRAAWGARPLFFSRRVWALALVLDRLPWPWGEELLAGFFLARAFVRTTRLRQALAWASAQTDNRRARWRLARSLCAHQGRFLARYAFVGTRNLESWQRLVSVRGEEHLTAAGRGVILLNFHLGPIASHLALRVTGHPTTWVGGSTTTETWVPEVQQRYPSSGENLVFDGSRQTSRQMRILHRARKLLLDGDSIMITADGIGREAFVVPLPGGPIVIREGWLALRRATSATVLPVLSHLEGRVHVVTIHPPLPPLIADRALDLEACRRPLADLLSEHVRRFPEHCYSLAFQMSPPGGVPAARARAGR